MVSNGTLLNRETARWIIADRSLHDLFISFDGARKETLERIRRGADYETILGNVEFLSALKKKQGLFYPRLSFHYIAMKSNAEELPEIFEICSRYGVDGVKVGYLNVSENMDVSESMFFHQKLAAEVFEESRHRAREWGIQLKLPDLPGPNSGSRRCAYPWQFTMIDPDGSVRFCYHAWRQRLGFFSDDFKSLWRGERYQKIRRTVNSNDPYYPYCRHCSVRVGPGCESYHNQTLHSESYIIPGLEHLQTQFNDRLEENRRSFTEFNKPSRLF
jgi:radical SAM protein with 4Fe4S-binding SPASM domain